jgi:hypothetical protein
MSRRVETDLLIRGMLSVHNLPQLGVVADKFLVYDPSSKDVKFRTAAQMLSDLGAASSSIGIDEVLANDNVTNLSLTLGGLAVNGAVAFTTLGSGILKVDANGNVYSDASSVIDVTDYDYDIIGLRNGINSAFILRNAYVPDSTKVYINGIRQTLGAGYDYDEILPNRIQFHTPPDTNDLLTVDYKITIP